MEKFELDLTDENIEKTILNNYLDNNRKLYTLSHLIEVIDKNMTICIDGDWGCGKTFFINQLMYIIKNVEKHKDFKIPDDTSTVLKNIKENNVIVYYDAWKNDNHIDAFQSIIYNILNEFPKYKDMVTEFNNIKNLLIDFAKNYINKKTCEIVDFKNILTYEDLANEIVTIEEKKEKFKELLEKILVSKRMILIIDELDRCNPIYASKVLETVKHFYDINNITVIIVANNRELSNTIKKQYGNNFNAHGYLNKFYDYIITLDNSKNIEYAQNVLSFSTTTWLPHNISYEMFKKYNFSYRDCNRFRTLYQMAEKYITYEKGSILGEKEYRIVFSIILPIIIAFRVKDTDSYMECVNTDKNDALKNALMYIKDNFEQEFEYKSWLKELVNTDKEDEIEKILEVYQKFKNNNISKKLLNDCIRMNF